MDPDGVIQAREILTPPVGRQVTELMRQIKAFQHVRETGEVAPSGRKPGKPTLKPGPDLVGMVWQCWKPEMAEDYGQGARGLIIMAHKGPFAPQRAA
jgi:hypothetical protein